ncbi:MAG TPA: hypothetical protein VLK33_09090, partial [Terriglobales bacterium]|nr:hypothetical protein [Terriglobales bacterium]
MTDALINVQLVIFSSGIALALIGLAFLFRKYKAAPSLPDNTVQYRNNAEVVIFFLAIYALDLFGTTPISAFHVLSVEQIFTRFLAALNLPILAVGVMIAYRLAQISGPINRLLHEGDEPERVIGKAERWLWPLGGFLALCAVLVFLELKIPFYFTQDDNLAQNLPSILWGCHNMFHGVFPTWNPYQYLGSPNTTMGWYALTYPPTYFSYWFAKTLLGNEYATIEVFAFFHLLLAYFVFYRLARREGCRPSIAMLGASCCMTSGYALIFSRSWFQFSPILLWVGLLGLCIQSFAKGLRGWKWIVAFGAAIGVAFHSGHIQMWIYTVLLADFALLLLFITRAVPWRAVWAPVAAHCIALAIAAPLLVPEIAVSIHTGRPDLDPRGIASGIAGMFLPASVWRTPHPAEWGCPDNKCFIGEMYYSGTLFTVLGAILLISLLASRWTRTIFRRNIWFCCGALAFWLALGDRGFLWNVMMHLPGFSRFRYPFKFLAYVVFFGSLAGAIVLERLMRNRRWQLKTELALASVMWLVLAYHSQLCDTAFFMYGFKPYPTPISEISGRLISHNEMLHPKVFSVVGHPDGLTEGRFANRSPNYYNTFRSQWATVLGIFSIEGYDPLVSQMPDV